MSKRRLGNLFRRKFLVRFPGFGSLKELADEQWVKTQLKDLSRLGGNLVVMKMGN